MCRTLKWYTVPTRLATLDGRREVESYCGKFANVLSCFPAV